MNPKRCFKCQELGHIAADCPNQKVITLAKWEAMKEDQLEDKQGEGVDVEGEKTQEEVIEEADEGEMLVLRRALSSQRSEKEE